MADIESIHHLSPMQKGILFHRTLQGGHDAFFGQTSMALNGTLNVDGFRQSWETILNRHPILRTAFITGRDGTPLQAVLKAVALPFKQEDLSALSAAERERRLNAILQSEREVGVDLSKAPLMRFTLVRTNDNEYRFVWSHHHLILDGWSISVILNELRSLYAMCMGDTVGSLPHSFPYADYLEWLNRQDPARGQQYWRNLLRDFKEPLRLHIDRLPLETAHHSSDARYSIMVVQADENLTAALRRMAKSVHVTLATIFYSAWALLLSKYAEVRDVVYGVTVSGRPAELQGIDQMVGLFINTLPIRVHIEPEMPFHALLRDVQQEQLEMREFESTPLSQVQEYSELPRGTPLFETIVAFENYPSWTGSVSRLPVSDVHSWDGSNYPLSIVVGARSRLAIKAIYSPRRFSESSIRQMLDGVVTILRESVDRQAAVLLRDVAVMDGEHTRRIMQDWCSVRSQYPRNATIAHLFDATANNNPDRVAVATDDERITYRCLLQRSNRLARFLRENGVRSEQIVGVYIDRSPEAVTGLLAILKAGGAYLPLSSSYPTSHLTYIIEDAGAKFILTQSRYVSQVRRPGVKVIDIDSVQVVIPALKDDDMETAGNADNLAYIMYTSGSTGRPKGVAVTQRGVIRLVRNTNYVSWDDGPVLQMSSPAFDASTFELWGSLLNGIPLILSPSSPMSLAELAHVIELHEISTLFLTAGLFAQFVDEHITSLASVRQLLAGGDVLSPPHVNRVLQTFPATCMINGYGPTENTTFTVCGRSTLTAVGSSMPIGRPIANTDVYILDENLKLTPPGVIGEIYIGGDGLARGYWNRPDLTAERFIPNPFSSDPGARLYRSGDRARWLEDGQVEFLGRTDRQVKIRGFRIELDEIESVLMQNPDIRQAVVIAVERGTGDKQLVAYYIPVDPEHADQSSIRDFLQQRLPDYMIPSCLYVLSTLPLTSNGKIDRGRLPDPTMPAVTGTDALSRARTPIEEVLLNLWHKLLPASSAGLDEKFFDVGGDSLLAMRLVSQIRQVFGVDLPLQAILENRPLRSLVEKIKTLLDSDAGFTRTPLSRREYGKCVPLSFNQEGLWFVDRFEGGKPTFNVQPAFRLCGPLDYEILHRSIDALVDRHLSLRTTFPELDGVPSQVVDVSPRPALRLFDVSNRPLAQRETAARDLASSEALAPYVLAEGPVFRPFLIRIDRKDHVLILALHHIICDGQSIDILVRDLSEIYAAIEDGRDCKLERLRIEYSDYASWQREVLAGGAQHRLVEYWKHVLLPFPPELKLRQSLPRPTTRDTRGETRGRKVEATIQNAINELTRREGVTKFMFLVACFVILLRHHSGNGDVVVGTDVASRDDPETERIVGFFVNQLPLRVALSGELSFAQLLARVRTSALGAYAHRDLPFDKLIEMLKVPRHANRPPIFQVKLIVRRAEQSKLTFPNVEVAPFPLSRRPPALDLMLIAVEADDSLLLNCEYASDLFEGETIDQYLAHFELMLRVVVTKPEMTVTQIDESLKSFDRNRLKENKRADHSLLSASLKTTKARPINPKELVEVGVLQSGGKLPLLIQNRTDSVGLAQWADEERTLIESKLLEHGAILFRGFGQFDPAAFEEVATKLCVTLFHQNGEHPRASVNGNVYSTIFYPPEEHLLWHNENSFNRRWPTKILFCCIQPPDVGGETTLVDSCRVFEALPVGIRDRFQEQGIMYVRNYGNGAGLDWKTVFQTDDRRQVEVRCDEEMLEYKWRSDGGLLTRARRPAVVQHTATGRWSWFNQAQHWHVSCLSDATRASIQEIFREEEYPRNCYYGDGSSIDDKTLQEILNVYKHLEVPVVWRSGDVLFLDNVLVAHGRNSYSGTRKLLVSMGAMESYVDHRFSNSN